MEARFATFGSVFIASALFAGCGGGISADEAKTVYIAAHKVSQDVLSSARSASTTDGFDLVVSANASGWSISGTLTGADVWTGSIDVSGSEDTVHGGVQYDLDLRFNQVSVPDENVTLDGELSVSESTSTSATSIDVRYRMDGDLDVTGSVTGRAIISVSVDASYDIATMSTRITAHGDIDGHDISAVVKASAEDMVQVVAGR